MRDAWATRRISLTGMRSLHVQPEESNLVVFVLQRYLRGEDEKHHTHAWRATGCSARRWDRQGTESNRPAARRGGSPEREQLLSSGTMQRENQNRAVTPGIKHHPSPELDFVARCSSQHHFREQGCHSQRQARAVLMGFESEPV